MTKKIWALLLMLACGAVASAAILAPAADAAPGACFQSPFGGYCDGPMWPDGTFRHCEGALGWTNCYMVRPVPLDVDPRGWVPA